MSFAEAARRLMEQVRERRAHVVTEEAAKQALILPFIQLLGFDVYDPREVIPEYKAGWAKATEKVDYALLLGGSLAIFVEAKGPCEVLSNYDPQLAKYFNSTPEVKFAIITNGVEYRFFTDLQEANILDKKPFFEFDTEHYTDTDLATLERFRRENFNVKSLVSYAEELVYLSALKTEFMRLLRDPDAEFVRFTIKSAGLIEGIVTQKIIDRFRPLVREGIRAAVKEIVGQSLEAPDSALPEPEEPQPAAEETASDGRVTTAEELAAFERIRCLIADHVPDPRKVTYRDTSSYLAVQYGMVTRWFARLYVQDRERKSMVLRLPIDRVRELAPGFEVVETPAGNGASRLYISSVEDLSQLGPLLAEAVKEVVPVEASEQGSALGKEETP